VSRNAVTPAAYQAGTMMSRPVSVQRWDMIPGTGSVTSVAQIPGTGWARGPLVQWGAVRLRPSGRNLYMYDPTDPETWRLGAS
jgi:hypothetical protein